MQEMNPNYKNYKFLAGIWKSNDGSFTADLTVLENITVTYNGASLKRSFNLTQTSLMTPSGSGGMMGLAMMMSSSSGMVSRRHDDEDMQLGLEGSILKDGEKDLYRIDECWHTYNDYLCFKLTDLANNNVIDIRLIRTGKEQPATESKGKYQCACGTYFDSKFCPNCGAQAPAPQNLTFQCECGYNGPMSRFCPNCGKMVASKTKSGAEQDLEKRQLLQHGWTEIDGPGLYKLIFKDNILKIFVIHYSNGVPVDLYKSTEYSFDPDSNGINMLVNGFKNTDHDIEEFAVYPNDWKLEDENNITHFAIVKIWYGFGTLHMDLANWGNPNCFTVDLKMDDSVKISDPESEFKAGWTCDKCGATNQTEDKCSECGAVIAKEQLFGISEFASCNPPRQDSLFVYRIDDKKLLVVRNKQRYFITADVIEPAMEIIRKYEIDKWEQYKDKMTGLMGGCQYVSYFDGEKMVGTSTDHLMNAGLAYGELNILFTAKSKRVE